MGTYISLLRWTSEGVKEIRKSPSRLDAAKKVFQDLGVTVLAFYMTTGQYDMVFICEAPDESVLAKALLQIVSKGAVQSETFRAFTEAEYRKIMENL